MKMHKRVCMFCLSHCVIITLICRHVHLSIRVTASSMHKAVRNIEICSVPMLYLSYCRSPCLTNVRLLIMRACDKSTRVCQSVASVIQVDPSHARVNVKAHTHTCIDHECIHVCMWSHVNTYIHMYTRDACKHECIHTHIHT